jgi:hypothetical protein
VGSVDWINLAQDRDKRKAVVNKVTNVRFHEMWEIS